MEVEIGNEESVQLQEGVLELAKSLEKLMIRPGTDPEEKSNPISELEVARENWIAEKRQAEKVVWRAKWVREASERSVFRERMEKLLPEERKKLLNEAKDPEDKRKKADLSLLLRELTKKDRTRYLSRKVLQILHENGQLPRNDMLGCRLACQEWRDSVDLYFQNLVSYPEEGEGARIRLNLYGDMVPQFREWSARTYPIRGNPFLGRKLLIFDSAIPVLGGLRLRLPNHGLLGQVEQLLQRWGGEVWDVFHWFERELNFTTMYLNLQRFLRLMPNLRYLGVLSPHVDESRMSRLIPDPSDDDDRLFTTENALKKRMAEIHLPEMPHLRVLDLHHVPPSIINGMLLMYGSTLETLGVYAVSSNPIEYGGGTMLPHLKKFDLRATIFHGVPPSSPKIDWPALEDLALKYSDLEAEEIPEVFAIANGFGKTLRKLTLTLHKEGSVGKLDEDKMRSLRLDLPRVEKFSLSVSRLNLKGVDFILPMAALKELSVTYHKFVSSFEKKKKAKKAEPGLGSAASASPSAANPGEREIIKFWDYTNCLYESNIWTIFPDLREVTIGVITELKDERRRVGTEDKQTKHKIYTREGYKRHLANGSGFGGDADTASE